MEKTVRILEQGELSTRKYNDRRTGEEKEIKSVTFKLTDGLDSFYAEMTGDKAANLPKLDKTYTYRVQCTMTAREWTAASTGERQTSTAIYLERIVVA